MDLVAEKLDDRLHTWSSQVADEVRQRVVEIIDLADQDSLDLARSRQVEQDVLDLLDGTTSSR